MKIGKFSLSRTWLMGLVAGLVIQYQPQIEAYLPQISDVIIQFVPPPYNALLLSVIPPFLAWFTAMAFTWARNKGVEDQTVTNPVTGTKSIWKKKN